MMSIEVVLKDGTTEKHEVGFLDFTVARERLHVFKDGGRKFVKDYPWPEVSHVIFYPTNK